MEKEIETLSRDQGKMHFAEQVTQWVLTTPTGVKPAIFIDSDAAALTTLADNIARFVNAVCEQIACPR